MARVGRGRKAGRSVMGATAQALQTVAVTIENFVRAESDLYFGVVVKKKGFGQFEHNRAPIPIDQQTVVRMNRDTLYSGAVFDLEAAPVTITLPDPGPRFMSMQIISQDQYSPLVAYEPGPYVITRDAIRTRYVLVAVRIIANPALPGDLDEVHQLQDAIRVEQTNRGRFEVPNWDPASQKRLREALLVLGTTLPDSRNMFGRRSEVDPVRFVIGAAMAWGGNPEREATYLNVTPTRNDGRTVHTLTVKNVPVDGFWSISVYNSRGYFEPNTLNAYTLNNLTARREPDGSIAVRFGGCEGSASNGASNCLPITPGWNYLVRLYRPRAEILDGSWTFPEAQPVS